MNFMVSMGVSLVVPSMTRIASSPHFDTIGRGGVVQYPLQPSFQR